MPNVTWADVGALSDVREELNAEILVSDVGGSSLTVAPSGTDTACWSGASSGETGDIAISERPLTRIVKTYGPELVMRT